MTAKKLIGAATLGLLLTAGVAAAQTTYPTTNTGSANTNTGVTSPTTNATGTTDTTGTTNTGTGSMGSSTLPGTPNTGAGGNAAENMLLLGSSALAAIAGMAYLLTRKPLAR